MLVKRILSTILAITLLFSPLMVASGQAAVLETTAESVILIDAGTGKTLFEKTPHKKLPPASVTKIMTLLLAMEAINEGKAKLTDKVTASENACSLGGSQIYLEPGEEFSMKEMLISIAVGSANDSCVAVAEHIAGSHEAFVKQMNDKAKELGLKNTQFMNAYGLPAEGHYTSAYDMAQILRKAISHSLFKEVTSIKEYQLRGGEFVLYNTNKLLWWYKGADGGKTGWTNEAKYCLASTVERDGLRMIAVVLGTPEPRSHFRESMKLYNYGFANFEVVELKAQGMKMATIQVGKGVTDKVGVVTQDKVSVLVPKGKKEGIDYQVVVPKVVQAPIKKGQKIGEIVITKDKQEVSRVDLVANNEIAKGSPFRQIFKVMKGVLSFTK